MCLLRSVFANPAICKVFHGADSDILWLQQEFHIYVVNLFDTARHPGTVGELCQARAPEVLARLPHYLLRCYLVMSLEKKRAKARDEELVAAIISLCQSPLSIQEKWTVVYTERRIPGCW